MDDSVTGSDFYGAAQSGMKSSSPLVKRRSHVRSSMQKRVSFHHDQMRRPEEACNLSHATSQHHLSSYCIDDRIPSRYPASNIRRYHSDIAINQSTGSLAKYPTIAERGVPEGQEDPESLKSDRHHLHETCFHAKTLHRRSAQLKKVNSSISMIEKRRYLEWARKKWENLNSVPELPFTLIKNLSTPEDNDLPNEIFLLPETKRQVPALVELDPKERYKVFKCFTDFYLGTPQRCQLVVSESMIYLISSVDVIPKILWEINLLDIYYVKAKWNYSVLEICTGLEHVSNVSLHFGDPVEIQKTTSLIDVFLKKIRKDLQLVFVEPISKCKIDWQSHVYNWIEHDNFTGDQELSVEYIGLVFFEESFFLHNSQSDVSPNKGGHLMFRWSSSRSWQPGYFLIQEGVLYQFSHQNDSAPVLKLSLSEEECKGYGRNLNSKRPHTIELHFRNDRTLLLAAASEPEAVEWLASLSLSSFAWDNMTPSVHSLPIACGILVTQQQVFLFKTAQLDQPIASAPLEIISVIMMSSLPDTFCLIELECREASEGTGDWILYFQSETSYEDFLNVMKRPREMLPTASSSTLRNKSLLLNA